MQNIFERQIHRKHIQVYFLEILFIALAWSISYGYNASIARELTVPAKPQLCCLCINMHRVFIQQTPNKNQYIVFNIIVSTKSYLVFRTPRLFSPEKQQNL